MKDTCRTCKHFVTPDNQCRLNPPVSFFVGLREDGQPQVMSTFPNTQAHLCCGKHEGDFTDVPTQ
jgi:hypothetical protein